MRASVATATATVRRQPRSARQPVARARAAGARGAAALPARAWGAARWGSRSACLIVEYLLWEYTKAKSRRGVCAFSTECTVHTRRIHAFALTSNFSAFKILGVRPGPGRRTSAGPMCRRSRTSVAPPSPPPRRRRVCQCHRRIHAMGNNVCFVHHLFEDCSPRQLHFLDKTRPPAGTGLWEMASGGSCTKQRCLHTPRGCRLAVVDRCRALALCLAP